MHPNTFRFGLLATLFVEVLTWTPSDSQQIWLNFSELLKRFYPLFHLSCFFLVRQGRTEPRPQHWSAILSAHVQLHHPDCYPSAQKCSWWAVPRPSVTLGNFQTLDHRKVAKQFRLKNLEQNPILHDASWCLMQEKILSFLAELAERLGLWRLQTIKLCCEWSSRQQCHLFRSNAHQGVTRAHAHTLSQGPRSKISETHVAWKNCTQQPATLTEHSKISSECRHNRCDLALI